MFEHSFIADVQRRLVVMADDPPYIFRDTPSSLIQQEYDRLTHFKGFSEAEVCEIEAQLHGSLPALFRRYLCEMGRSPGDLFVGSEFIRPSGFVSFRDRALRMIRRKDPNATLSARAFVFLIHQGYTFLSIDAAEGDDGPVDQYSERQAEVQQIAPTFAQLVNSELKLMERTHQASHENGGSYHTLFDGGGASWSPAADASYRTLDAVPRGKIRWSMFGVVP